MTKDSVIERWYCQTLHGRSKRPEADGGNILYADKRIYSYGRHFCMAEIINDDNVVYNADRYSPSTAQHQSKLRNYLARTSTTVNTVSFSAANRLGIRWTDCKFIDWDSGANTLVRIDKETGNMEMDSGGLGWFPTSRPGVGEFQYSEGLSLQYDDNDKYKYGYWHIVEATVFAMGDRYFLSAVDEGSYFMAELSRKVESIDDAYESLKPQGVLDAEAQGLEVLRQGEWFFIPAGMTWDVYRKKFSTQNKKDYKKAFKKICLPHDNLGNRHEVVIVPQDSEFREGFTLVCGMVRHINRDNDKLSGEHKCLRLGDDLYYVYKNTEITSAKSNWKVD